MTMRPALGQAGCLLLTQTLVACAASAAQHPLERQPGQEAGTGMNVISPPQSGGASAAMGGSAAAPSYTGAGGESSSQMRAANAGARAVDAGTHAADAGMMRADMGEDAGPSTRQGACGDVIAAEHPAFAAIKRLATTQQEVRVLVYGQSISMQAWWTKTQQWLEATYPNGKLVMENHAHGGCSSQCLIGHEAYYLDGSQRNRLPEDVFAWKPDLILFHVYGDHVDYGYIMQAFSEGCSAFDTYQTYDGKDVPEVHCTPEQRTLANGYHKPEVLVQDDFVISDKQVDCPAQPTPATFDCFMNDLIIPQNVAKYQYRLQDNFHEFPQYIASHHLDPSTLIMSDQTHLAEPAGTDVMFALTVPHLCYEP